MLVYPQLSSGAVSQFPVVKKRIARTVVNTAADGSRITYADPAGGSLVWQLSYTGLSDAELSALQAFHAAAEGSLNGFTFVDPAGNLLAASEDLSNAAWLAGPLLSVSSADAGVWKLVNTAAGPQSLTQTLNGPKDYQYCFSLDLRAPQPANVTLLCGAVRSSQAAGAGWNRLSLAGNGDTFGIELPAGAAVEIARPQVEAQPCPSPYQASISGGVYTNARFRDDEFRFITTDVNRHSTTLTIFYANHL